MNSNKFHSNYVLLLLLVTAFLAMQWTAVHIHQADQHSHDRALHQHQVEKHAHNLMSKSVTPSDVSHQASHAEIIDIEHEINLSKRQSQETPSSAVIALAFSLPQAHVETTSKIDFVKNIKLRYLYRPSFNPRAPPLFS